MNSNLPVVSVVCITYNHEAFIAEAIEGFLIQETTFPIEILIHDDASTDRTPEIIRSYQSKHPDLIKPILQVKNQYSSRGFGFLGDLFAIAQGKYIALCEGDDYWTDPLKLQKQVDFLEANPEYAICCHNALIVDSRSDKTQKYKKIYYAQSLKQIITLEDLILNEGVGYIPTASTVFRATSISNIPGFFSQLLMGDYALYLLATRSGNIRFIDQVMSAYRINDASLLSTLSRQPQSFLWEKHVKFWKLFANSQILCNTRDVEKRLIFSIKKAVIFSLHENQFNVFKHLVIFSLERYRFSGLLILLRAVIAFLKNLVSEVYIALRIKLGIRTNLRRFFRIDLYL